MVLRPFSRARKTTAGRDDTERLPVSDGVPMESEQDAINARLYLCEPLKGWCAENDWLAFVGSNSFVYYKPDVPPVGPDFYAVNKGIQHTQEMWVSWREGGRMPSLIVEFLSDSTQQIDREKKMQIYRDEMRCLDYFLCDRDIGVTEGYRLRNGVYVRTRPDRNRRLRCGSLPLLLGFHGPYLRFFTLDGMLLPTDAERAAAALRRAGVADARAGVADARAGAAEARADAAEARAGAAEGRAETAEARVQIERERAQVERQRAEAEHQRAEAERLRAEEALAELRALRARLDEQP